MVLKGTTDSEGKYKNIMGLNEDFVDPSSMVFRTP